MSCLQRRACHGVVPHNGAISSTTKQLLWLLHTQPKSEHSQASIVLTWGIFGDSKRTVVTHHHATKSLPPSTRSITWAFPHNWMFIVASPNDIHYIEKLRNGFWSGSAILNAAPLYVPSKKLAFTVEISTNSLTTHIKLKRFCSSFSILLVRTFLLKNFYLYSRVLADFYKFHWTSKYMQPLPWEIGSLGCRFH